eukprot:g4532.t1
MALSKEQALEFVAPHEQEHILDKWDVLNKDEQTKLLMTLQSLNFAELNEIFKASTQPQGNPSTLPEESMRRFLDDIQRHIEPSRQVDRIKNRTDVTVSRWRSIGMKLIAQSKVAVVILAGGQGTRLGTNEPKGCFSIDLPSNKSLFQLHCERILSIQSLANKECMTEENEESEGCIRVYVMTSVHTHEATIQFFLLHRFFGLDSSQVVFFQQNQIPCFTLQGKIIMETNSTIAMSPDGNGGIYGALEESGTLERISKAGVECVDCFSVDNLLAKAADPLFIGYCYESNLPCGARVVAKECPEEKVGVFVMFNEKQQVVEYSELPQKLAECPALFGDELLFKWGNICMQYFTTSFLNKVAKEFSLPYHAASKQIRSQGSTLEGIKLEKFIFDVFPLADGVALMEVAREEEYAPIKNAPGASSDSPDTAREALFKLHRKWIRQAGGIIDDHSQVEISPLSSYEGEGLTELCKGRNFVKERMYLC